MGTYFASADRDDIGRNVWAKAQDHETNQLISSISDRLRRAYMYYFGLDSSGIHATSQIGRGGEVGELARFRVNYSRAHVQTLFNLTTAPKVVWTPVASNSDSASATQAILAANILEYYWLDRDVWQYFARATEEAIAFTEGFVFTPWDKDAGDEVAVDPETGAFVRSGDFRFINLSSWDVIRDPNKKSWNDLDWVLLRVSQNRHTLAALYPQYAEDILGADDRELRQKDGRTTTQTELSDEVYVYYFFHRRTAALPAGRETVVVGPECVLHDDAFSYDDFPLHRIAPAELTGTPFGYSQYMEVLGIQELIDSLESAVATNQDTGATTMIAVQRSEPFQPEDIGGAKIVYYSDKPPAVLSLAGTAPEVFKNLEEKKADMQRIMGLNDAVSGNLPPGGKLSGAALALLSTQATQNNSQLQANYVKAIRSCGNTLLREFQKRATAERKITLAGRNGAFLQREEKFDKRSIEKVKSVLVDIGNPLQQTASGRIELANLYQQHGVKLTPDQLVQVISTGRMEPLVQGTQKELLLILAENEEIAAGRAPVALIHDDHLLHGREHRNPVTSIEARANVSVLKADIEHLHQHYTLFWGWQGDPTMDPFYRDRMLILVGQQPPQMAPPPPGAPPPGNGAAPELGGPQTPPGSADLPSLPTNPVTGDEYNPQDGGSQIPS